MKNLVFGASGLMMIGLIIATIFYQTSTQITPPQRPQTIEWEHNGESKNKSEQQQSDKEQPLYAEDAIDYSLQNDQLSITFDKGNNWITVPIEKDKLFDGEYRGNKQELIENSYILTEDRTAFLYAEGSDWNDKEILLTYSLDQGETWQEAVVTEHFPAMRFRKIAFLNENFGYVIISGGRTMSQEYSSVFLTYDGGKHGRKQIIPM